MQLLKFYTKVMLTSPTESVRITVNDIKIPEYRFSRLFFSLRDEILATLTDNIAIADWPNCITFAR